jgi:hypothetical protein
VPRSTPDGHAIACRIAETLIDLRRVRSVKLPLVAELAADLRNAARPLKALARLDRYERLALSRRKTAVRSFRSVRGRIGKTNLENARISMDAFCQDPLRLRRRPMMDDRRPRATSRGRRNLGGWGRCRLDPRQAALAGDSCA